MNHLDKLISQYCPNGVPFVRLGDGICIYTGEQLNRTFMLSKGIYPVVNGGIEASGFINKYNEEAQTITMSQGGASAGFVNFQNTRFWAGAHCYVIKPIDNNKIDNRYLFYYLKQMQFKLQQNQQGAGIPSVGRSLVHNMSIPLPPLPVQQEIVRILDSMTDLIANLDSEIATRQQQYAHYRDQLLSFGSKVEAYTVIWLPNERIDTNGINKTNYVSVENLLKDRGGKIDAATIPQNGTVIKYIKGDILIGNIRPYLRKIWLADCDGATNGDVVVIRPQKSLMLLSTYLYHVFASEHFFSYYNGTTKGGKMPRGEKKKILSYLVPLPPLSIQQEIVAKLDAFESLLATLRRERTLRQQQYEYYRERLLSFHNNTK